MASMMLRSGKFARYFVGFARNVVFNTQREAHGNIAKHSQVLCASFSNRGFATSFQSADQNLEKSIKKLDHDVRQIGRISRRDIEEVLDEIRHHRTASTSQSLLIIRCCGNLVPEELPEVRTALVQEIWKTLNNLNVPMDISHYNALLRVFLENEHPFSPTEFLTNLESKGIEPNRVTYQRLIARYCQQGDIDGATRILEFMREKQHPINEHVFNALIMGHSEAGDLESAVGILSVMKQAGLSPTADTYGVLLCAYAKVGNTNQILTTLDTCEANDIYLLDRDLFDIIYTLSTNGHSDKVDQIIPRLRKSAGYNQDAVNLILRLVNKGEEDVAFVILKTMQRGVRSNGEFSDTGTFFIKQLVKAKRPVDKILSFCKELQSEGLNNRALLVALEMGITSGMIDIATPILKEIQALDLPIRQHYFWPLICSQAKTGTKDILDVLRLMQSDFNITPNGETIRDFVIPNMNERNYDKIILMLRTAGISTSMAVSSAVCHALNQFKIREAAQLTTTYTIYYRPSLLRRPLVDALVKTQDYQSYISILRSVYENHTRLELIQNRADEELDNNVDAEINENNPTQSEVLGQFVYDAVARFRDDRVEAVTRILSGLVEQGLTMSPAHAQRIQEKLGSQLTTEISTLLGTLTTGELEPLPYESRSMHINFSDMPADQLEKMIQQKEAKGEDTKGLYRSLLIAYFRANDVQKSEETIKKLETIGFTLTSGLYARLIEVYCNGNVDKALKTFSEIKAKEPDFKLDDLKMIKVAHALVTSDRIDEAIEFLNTNKRDEKTLDERNFNYNTTCWQILNFLADKGKADDLTRIFECMKQNNCIEISNMMLGPLVKVHLVNDDILKAVDVFETISNEYQCTPWKNDLACKLIEKEDATNLQRLTDLSTNIHGEVNSLYDLVFSFVDCGRIRQARRILETPGLGTRQEKLNDVCRRYRKDGRVESLEGLIDATRDLNYIDRHQIFYNLLLTYCDNDKPEKALGLWTKIQEEDDVAPTEQFLTKLAEYLESKSIEIPFVKPTTLSKRDEKTAVSKAQPKANAKQQPTPKTGKVNQSKLLELMVQENRYDEANKYILDMIKSNIYPSKSVFRFYMHRIAETGNYAALEEISKFISADLKRVVSFDNNVCHAYAVAGKAEQFLDQLEKKLNNAVTTEELNLLAEEFPRGGSQSILVKAPELVDKFEKLAEKYAEKGINSPINVVWEDHLINGNLESADRIWSSYLINSPQIMFRRILQTARKNNDEKLVQKLINVLKTSKATELGLGVAHSCYIDVLSNQMKFDEALNAVDAAIEDTCLENINRTTLVRLKDGADKAGKIFPHTIPEKQPKGQVDTSSSSSSSDDEPPIKNLA